MRWPHRHHQYVTREQFNQALADIDERINQMASQTDVDALTAQVGQVAADLATARTSLQTEIDALSSAHPSLDLSALQSAVAPLDAAAVALGGLAPTPPPAV